MSDTLLEANHTRVQPIPPIAPYVGGKRWLAKYIIPIIENLNHTRYVEPFIGMGGIFFRRRLRPYNEVINDYNSDIFNLFSVIRDDCASFLEYIDFAISSRQERDRLLKLGLQQLKPVEKAYRFLYLLKHSFNGKGLDSGICSYRGRFNSYLIMKYVRLLHKRLAPVFIEHLDYSQCIERHDKKGTLFYLDPPYIGKEHYYPQNNNFDFEAFSQCLFGIKNQFILSINDCEMARDLLGKFFIQEISVDYPSKHNGKPALHRNGYKTFGGAELIVTNFPTNPIQTNAHVKKQNLQAWEVNNV